MTLPIITALCGSILGILQMVLMVTVGNQRRAMKISLGDGGNEMLLRRMRRHGNLAENAPLFLILLALLEILGGATLLVQGLAIVFVLARFSHALAFTLESQPLAPRAAGAVGNLLSVVVCSVALFLKALELGGI